jgi:hypothetical protein
LKELRSYGYVATDKIVTFTTFGFQYLEGKGLMSTTASDLVNLLGRLLEKQELQTSGFMIYEPEEGGVHTARAMKIVGHTSGKMWARYNAYNAIASREHAGNSGL